MSKKPASRYFAKGLWREDKNAWAGQFAAPGLVPDLVRSNGRVELFDREDDAELAASRALIGIMNSRATQTRRSNGYQRMAGADMAKAISDAGITVAEFGRIFGTKPERVIKWIDGEADIPHAAYLFCGMIKSPRLLEGFQKAADNRME